VYLTVDWPLLQQELKGIYWQHDRQRATPTALNQLIKDAPTLDLTVFILKYTSTTATLVSKGALSQLDRVGRLLDGLSTELWRRVLKFCTKKSWRLSANDTGAVDPVFEELKEFVLTEAKAAQTRKETVYTTERATRESGTAQTPLSDVLQTAGTSTTTTTTTSITSSATPVIDVPTSVAQAAQVPAPPSAPDPITELTKQFSNLALLLQANMHPVLQTSNPNVTRNVVQPARGGMNLPQRQLSNLQLQWLHQLQQRRHLSALQQA
jgi:hypothetical protein